MTIGHVASAFAALTATFAARGVAAQNGALDPSCPAAPTPLPTIPSIAQAQAYYQTQLVRDACQKAIDIFQFVAPQLGTSVAGGNAVLGRGGALGGPGHFSIGLRGNIVSGGLPQLQNVQLSTDGPQRTDITTKNQVVGLPGAEVSVGLFSGVPVGLTRVGGVDAIVSAFYVPNYSNDDFSLRTGGGSLKLGLGGRLGILQETRFVPGVSLTYLRRDLPTVNVTARTQQDTVRVTGIDARTAAWRLVASKSLPVVGFAAGVGQDRYTSGAGVSAYIAPRSGLYNNSVPYTTPAFNGAIAATSQRLTRTNYFLDGQVGLPVAKLVGEVGQVSGGAVRATYNTFGTHTAGESYTYFSVGLRFGR